MSHRDILHELQGDSSASKQALARLPGQLMPQFTHSTSRRPKKMSISMLSAPFIEQAEEKRAQE